MCTKDAATISMDDYFMLYVGVSSVCGM